MPILDNSKIPIDSLAITGTESITSRLAVIATSFSGKLYHGTNLAGLTELKAGMEDYMGCNTLGEYVYFTDDQMAGRNYAINRANARGGAPILYSVDLQDANIADLGNPSNIRLILPMLADYIEHLPTAEISIPDWMYRNSIKYLRHAVDKGLTDDNIRKLLENNFADKLKFSSSWMMHNIGKFLKANNFDGLSCPEGGEGPDAGIKWEPFTTYAIFNLRLCVNLNLENI